MKRYALFEFDQYYPSGGWSDFVNSFDSVDEAVSFYNLPRPREGMKYDTYPADNYQVVDLHFGDTVSEG